MPDFDDVILNLVSDILPTGIQLGLLLIAFIGMWIIGSAMLDMYSVMQDDYRRRDAQKRAGSMLVRCLIGGLMTVPAVVLWRVADGLMGGGGVTETALLSYSGGTYGAGYCDKFKAGVVMTFMLSGVIALLVGFVAIDDQARGINQTGARSGLLYIIGGVVCFFILDVIEMLANTTGFDLGFESLCTALGG